MRPCALAALIAIWLSAPSARAQQPAARALSGSRCYAGSDAGLDGRRVWVDGREVPGKPEELTLSIGASFACSVSLGRPTLGLLGLVHAAAVNRGYDRERSDLDTRADVALGPELRLQLRGRRPYDSVHVSLPIGYTATFSEAELGRAVRQRYENGYGINVGLIAGYILSGPAQGVQFDVVHHLYWLAMDHTEQLVGTPAPALRQRYRILQYMIGVSVSYAFWL